MYKRNINKKFETSFSYNKSYNEKINKNIDDKYLKFYSNAKPPYNKLSNFYYVKEGILYNGLKYPSVEHAYQASKFNNEEDKKDFTLTGKYGTEDGFKLLYKPSEYQDKQNYWMKKESIGILAKMGWKRYPKSHYTFKQLNEEEWIKILKAKFSIKEFKDLLLSTNDKILYEFKKNPDDYTAYVNDKGKLVGKNFTGKWLMMIRDEIKNNEDK